jgi:hypothetical protein
LVPQPSSFGDILYQYSLISKTVESSFRQRQKRKQPVNTLIIAQKTNRVAAQCHRHFPLTCSHEVEKNQANCFGDKTSGSSSINFGLAVFALGTVQSMKTGASAQTAHTGKPTS